MAMRKTNHPICKKGFRMATSSGNYTRFRPDIKRNHWIGRTGSKDEPSGWQPRSYQQGQSDGPPFFYWEGPIVKDPWTAYVIGEVAGWGE